jgi:hypothetical protein
MMMIVIAFGEKRLNWTKNLDICFFFRRELAYIWRDLWDFG